MSSVDMASLLRAVRTATKAVAKAEMDRVVAIQQAHQAGATVTALAEAAKVGRPTIYRVLRDERALPPEDLWEDTLRDGLRVAAERGSMDAMAIFAAPIQTMPVLASYTLRAVRQIRALPEFGSADRERLQVAMDLAREVQRRLKAGEPLPR